MHGAVMNRSNYFNICEQRLSFLCTSVELRGKLNLLEFHIHCEDFYAGLLNLLHGYNLKNMNQAVQNAAGFDLVDSARKIVLQVSSTATKQKLQSALSSSLSAYAGYRFEFVSISKDASALRGLAYKIPQALKFSPASDIHDVASILNHILHMETSAQKSVADFLIKEIVLGGDRIAAESNIAAVIKILAKEDLSQSMRPTPPIPFDVDQKLVFNGLSSAAVVIEDYKIHHGRINRIYAEFDSAGQNKSKSVLDSLRRSYINLSSAYSSDELFFRVVDAAITVVNESANHDPMPLEELELCVSVLAVDAFIRCRIFKNPMEVSVAAP